MLRKIADLQTLDAYRVPVHANAAQLRKAAHRVSFEYTPRPGFLYVRSRAISSRCNDNFDEFPAEEIKKAFRSFVGKPVFVNHHNEDHKRLRGVIIDAALHEDRNPDGSPDTWAEVLMEVDAKTFPKLAKAILKKEVDRTSMGCDVQLSVCSACGNKATNPAEYCQHIPAMKGQRIFRATASGRREGHLVREICYGLGFFENSLLVEEPADPTAYFLGVDDRGLKATASYVPTYGGTHCLGCGEQVRYNPAKTGTASQGWFHDDGQRRNHPAIPADADKVIASIPAADAQRDQMGASVREELGMPVRHDPTMPLDPFVSAYAPELEPYELNPREGAAGPKYPDPADHPFFQQHPSHPDNIVASWHEADDGMKAQGKRWYSDAHIIAGALAHGDHAMGAGVLAAYSPKAPWQSNMNNAARSLHEGRALGKGEGESIMGMHQRLAQRMIGDAEHPPEHHSKVLKSPKISDFAHLIEHGGDEDPETHTRVVIDRHALSVATGHRMTTKDLEDAPLGSRHYYEHVANHYRQAAATVSDHEGERIHPHQVQAVTWLVQQHKNMAHDLAQPGGGGKGRQTRDRNAWDRWQQMAPEHIKDPNPGNIHLVSPHSEHAASKTAARIGVDDADSGRKMITLSDGAGKSGAGNLTREDGRWYVENEYGEHVGEAARVPQALKMLTEHYDMPGPHEVEHTDNYGRTTKTYTLPTSRKTSGLNDVVAPPEVDTLRNEECPVCGETEVYDGERCPVCGFVAPPEMFRDPNLEMAKQVDLRGGQEQMNPEQAPGQANPDVPGGGLIDPSQLGDSPMADQLQHPDQMNPNGIPEGPMGEPGTPGDGVADLFCPACGEGFDAGQPMSTDGDPATVDATGPTEGMPCPNCGQSTLLSPDDMQAMEQMGEAPMEAATPEEDNTGGGELPPGTAPPEGEGPPEQQDEEEDAPPEQDDDSDEPPVDDDDRPSKGRDDKNSKGASSMSKSVEAAVGGLMRELAIIRAQNELIAKAAGLDDQFAEIRRQADINNPASPVPDPGEEQAPESTEQAVTPEAMDDPQRPGQTPQSVQGVPAEQVDTPLRPGVTMPTSPANNLIDVTAPVAGTNTGEVPLEQRRIETDVRVGDPMAGAGSDEAKMFPWTMGANGNAVAANRTMASMRLAELRIAAQLAPAGDKFALTAAIETDASLSDDAMAAEIRTLEAIGRTAARQPRPAGLVPRAAAHGDRGAPSLAPATAGVSSGGGYDDTADADLFF